MSDPERLQQLRRQRANVAEHLAWLDREIQRAVRLGVTPTSEAPTPTPAATPSPPSFVPANPTRAAGVPPPSPALAADPDAILEEWTEQAGGERRDQPISKTGCWIIFAALAVVGIGSVVGLIYFIYG